MLLPHAAGTVQRHVAREQDMTDQSGDGTDEAVPLMRPLSKTSAASQDAPVSCEVIFATTLFVKTGHPLASSRHCRVAAMATQRR